MVPWALDGGDACETGQYVVRRFVVDKGVTKNLVGGGERGGIAWRGRLPRGDRVWGGSEEKHQSYIRHKLGGRGVVVASEFGLHCVVMVCARGGHDGREGGNRAVDRNATEWSPME